VETLALLSCQYCKFLILSSHFICIISNILFSGVKEYPFLILKDSITEDGKERQLSSWEEEILSYGNNWEHDEGTSHASDLEALLKVIEYCNRKDFQVSHQTMLFQYIFGVFNKHLQGLSAMEKTNLIQEVFTSWPPERCDKIKLLAESFLDCPESVSFLAGEEDEKGGLSSIRYTWMMTSAFRKLEDQKKLAILKRFASGKIASTAQAIAAMSAAPYLEQALLELQKVHYLLIFYYFFIMYVRS
jgi:hypothetical protein